MKKERNGSQTLRPQDGKSCHLGSIGVRFMIDGNDSSGRFSLDEHPMEPRALAAPLHRHRNEDEYSFVIEGRIGADLGGEIVSGNRGDLIFKPRNQWHTFWNAGDEPARVLEIISPAGSTANLSFDFQVDLDTVSDGCLFVVQLSRASSFRQKMVGRSLRVDRAVWQLSRSGSALLD
jgi:mannose-6-phosphate isomerase-like protein (cupin superfamily)